MSVTRGNWARDFCAARNLEPTLHRLNALVSWETAEGTDAKFNPLATTWDMPNDTLYNSTGVRNYNALLDGLTATWLTLEKGDAVYNYQAIRRTLNRNAPAKEILLAVANSAWGTGWLALTVLPFVQANFALYAKKPIGQ